MLASPIHEHIHTCTIYIYIYIYIHAYIHIQAYIGLRTCKTAVEAGEPRRNYHYAVMKPPSVLQTTKAPKD